MKFFILKDLNILIIVVFLFRGEIMIKEFKKFISKGNVIDLAVGVIVGAAFNKIVTSLVENILMPLIGVISGGLNFTSLSITIGKSVINYGTFIQNIIDFFIVAFSIFVLVKTVNKLTHKKEMEKSKKPSEEILLLTEIKNELIKQNKKISKFNKK